MPFVSYAQNFEDVILWRALKHVKGGFYLDIGAQDPVIDSVSLAFYESGWRGVHVEPVAQYAAKLRISRPNDEVIEAAVTDRTDLVLYEVPDTGLSTGSRAIAEGHRKQGFQVRATSVSCVRLSYILDRHRSRDIHWLKIDVEGMELEVIRSWFPSKVRPWIVLVESTKPNTPKPNFAAWEPLLLKLGYDFVYFDGLNRYYVSRKHRELKASFGPGPNCFDDFVFSGFASQPFCSLLTSQAASLREHLAEREKEAEVLQRRAEELRIENAAQSQIFAKAISVCESSIAAVTGAYEATARDLAARDERIATLAADVSRLDQDRFNSLQNLAERDQEVARLSRTIESLRTAAATESSNFAKISSMWASEVSKLDDEASRLRRQLAETSETHARQLEIEKSLRDASRGEVDRLRQEISLLNERLAGIYHSTSWNVTAPLRFFGHIGRLFVRGVWNGVLRPRGRRAYDAARQPSGGPLASAKTAQPRARESSPIDRHSAVHHINRAEFALSAETNSVREAYRRLMLARKNLAHGLPLDWKPSSGRPRLAYISPLPPEHSGIANYSAELLPELTRHYDIDVIVDQQEISDPWIRSNCAIRTGSWFDRHAHHYDRILYHFGNSSCHRYMLPLISRHPGTVVLHDFFLSGLIEQTDLVSGGTGLWPCALYQSHGYAALREHYNGKDAVWKYPANLAAVRNAVGVIVHSDYTRGLASRFYHEKFADEWAVIPHLRRLPYDNSREAARLFLGYGAEDFVVCAFGMMGKTKQNHRCLQAWLNCDVANDPRCHLVFVGQEDDGDYGRMLQKLSQESPAGSRVRITGFASPELYRKYLSIADAAVQLRTLSRGETSGTVLDCMAHAVPTIVNAQGSLAELPQDSVVMLPDEFAEAELAAAIEKLRRDPIGRRRLGEQARRFVQTRLSPRLVANRYQKAIEGFAKSAPPLLRPKWLAAHAGQMAVTAGKEVTWLQHARELSKATSTKPACRQLLVDVSAIAREDLKTGIQRVVKSQLLALLDNPPPGFRIEPVWLCDEGGQWRYYYARRYMSRLLSFPEAVLDDDPLEVCAGDIFFSPDLFVEGVVRSTESGLYAGWRARGVRVNFLIHDVLPLTMPEYFPSHVEPAHARWLCAIADASDRLICVSQAVANDTERWLRLLRPEVLSKLEIVVSHSGADIDTFGPSTGQPSDAPSLLGILRSRPSFLMVGTIEPRKGHLQTIAAFEQLWSEGVDINLVIVGIEGWKTVPEKERRTIPEIVRRLRGHPELGRRLFWLEGISDEYLQEVYSASACLLAASENEGFGLPLIEAAKHQVPILARDIPVFLEIAGKYASYFSGKEPEDLACAVQNWLQLHAQNRHPQSDDMPWLTWAQSTECLKQILLKDPELGTSSGQAMPKKVFSHGAVLRSTEEWKDARRQAAIEPLLSDLRHIAVGEKIGADDSEGVKRQLLVDVSAVARVKLRTGIQRVVKAHLITLLNKPPPGFQVEPVWLCEVNGEWCYLYARRYMSKLLSLPDPRRDESIRFARGDILFAPDYFTDGVIGATESKVYAKLRASGVKISFLIYDLLPLTMPSYFPDYAEKMHEGWLTSIAESADQLICISRAVAEETKEWLLANKPEVLPRLEITFSPLGADIDAFDSSRGLPLLASDRLKAISSAPSFLMVGTIEPRKGHLQTIAAFERLWKEGMKVNLVLVGAEGWAPEIVKTLRGHPELNKRLLWFEGISDEYLNGVYAASVCLIAASEGEGFGLPLIEAARHGLPIIARDIPVFREVAGRHASYFSGKTPEDLARAIQDWLVLFAEGRHPRPDDMPWLTWDQSTEHLKRILLGETSAARPSRGAAVLEGARQRDKAGAGNGQNQVLS